MGDVGKIRGDGRTFLDRFKSYFGSQISSQSLNVVHIRSTDYSRNSQQKVIFFHIFLSLIVSSQCNGLQKANEAEVLLGKQAMAIKNHGKYTEKKIAVGER